MKLSKGRFPGALKVVIYGPEGIGKSTFASHFPNPVFIDTEGSTRQLDVVRVDPAPASFAELTLCVAEFIAHPDVLGTLVIDTADWAEKLCRESVCAQRKMNSIEDAGYGKGYTYVEEEFGRLLSMLETLREKGVHIVVTAHAKMRKFEQPDELGAYDRWELKMSKNVAPLVKEWADMLLFANYKTMVVNVDNQGAAKGRNKAHGGARVMYTTHHPCWDAKNRFGLPDELPFDYAAIAAIIQAEAAVPPSASEAAMPPSTSEAAVPPSNSEGAAMLGDALRHEAAATDAKATSAAKPVGEGSGHSPAATDAKAASAAKLVGGGSGHSPAATGARGMSAAKLVGGGSGTAAGGGSGHSPAQWKEGVPNELLQLMEMSGVGEAELRRAVAVAGFFPEETPINKYPSAPDNFFAYLVSQWSDVLKVVETLRASGDVPF